MLDPKDDAALEDWFEALTAWDAERELDVDAPRTIAYGPDPEQEVDLWTPRGGDPARTVVSIHGGYFMQPYTRALHRPIIRELVQRGFAVWDVEYRRAGCGGGLPETTDDVWSAVTVLAELQGASPGSLAVFGHSAGGYLAEWLAPHPAVGIVVPLAAVTDLPGAIDAGWDEGAIVDWMGATPRADPALYRSADLRQRLPAGKSHVLLHGDRDSVVGIQQSRSYTEAVRAAGDRSDLVELADAGHYGFLDPREPAFEALAAVLDKWRGRVA